MTEIQTTTTDDCIEATTDTATLRVDTAVVAGHSEDDLRRHVTRLAGTCIATADSTGAGVTFPDGDMVLTTGRNFGSRRLDGLRYDLSQLVTAVVKTYFHVELDGDAPEYYHHPMRADGGER